MVSFSSVNMSILLPLLFLLCAEGFSLSITTKTLTFNEEHMGDKLLLTPYVKAGRIKEARKLAEVPPLIGNVKSYAGYFTADDESCDSNMFFWFFPAVRNMETAPVAVWLQGGPGRSSLFGLFTENGPYQFTPDKLQLRNYSWTEAASIVYIDNPVGTGFSYTSEERCYSTNQTHIGQNLLTFVRQFFVLFPELKSNPFYVAGESYAGKFVLSLGYAIHTHNRFAEGKINFQGLIIGDGYVDPINQLPYSDFPYQIGLLDQSGRDFFAQMEKKCEERILEEHWTDAYMCFDNLLNGDIVPWRSAFYNLTGFDSYFNFLHTKRPPLEDLAELVNLPKVRNAIHVGNASWNDVLTVAEHLREDIMKSVAPWLEEILEYYRVLVFNGQLDIIVPYPLVEDYLKRLQWSGAEEYKTAKRQFWRVGSELAGYAKTAGNLTQVLVRNAGHMVSADQPEWAFDLISRFFNNKPFS